MWVARLPFLTDCLDGREEAREAERADCPEAVIVHRPNGLSSLSEPSGLGVSRLVRPAALSETRVSSQGPIVFDPPYLRIVRSPINPIRQAERQGGHERHKAQQHHHQQQEWKDALDDLGDGRL